LVGVRQAARQTNEEQPITYPNHTPSVKLAGVKKATPEGTRLDLDVQYTIPMLVLGRLAEKAIQGQNEREAERARG
jgi:hypothetical protein